MDDSTRAHKASEIARGAARAEAHEEAAFAAEAARREAREKYVSPATVQAAGQTAYDSVYQRTYQEVYEGLREMTLHLLNCYDRQLHPASVPAAALVAEVLEELDPQHQTDPAILWSARVTPTKLADKILQACKLPDEPN
jgi:hypothetical protein